VAAILESEHDFRVEVVHWPLGFPEAVSKLRPRLVILPFCYSDQNYRMLLAFWRESIFLNLAWEQLFYFGNQKAKSPRDDFPLKHVFHHTWSNEYAEFLNRAGIPTEHIFVNGQPAYALYEEPYRRHFSSRKDLANRYHLDESSRWVFFPENYNWAFYSEKMIGQFVENGQSPDDIQVMRDYCEQSLAAVLHWCAQIAREDGVEIILRPRPSTSITGFLAFVNSVLPEIPIRFHILRQETVREWVLASDMIVSSHSTSLIEAAVAGKYSSIVAPFPIPSQLHVDWHDLLPHITTEKDFIQIVKSTLLPESDLGQWARQSMMSRGDAIRNLSNYIVLLLCGDVRAPSYLPEEALTSWFKIIPPAWMWSLYRRFKFFLRYPAYRGIDPAYDKDYLPRNEIRSRINNWMSLITISDQ
jgi:hypothetical protein